MTALNRSAHYVSIASRLHQPYRLWANRFRTGAVAIAVVSARLQLSHRSGETACFERSFPQHLNGCTYVRDRLRVLCARNKSVHRLEHDVTKKLNRLPHDAKRLGSRVGALPTLHRQTAKQQQKLRLSLPYLF